MSANQLSRSHLNRVRLAICRQVPKSIHLALSSQKERYGSNVDYAKAVDQHALYMDHLREAVGRGSDGVYVCAAEEKYPDCVFVEDAAVVSGPTTAVSTTIGAESRRGEEVGVLDALLHSGIEQALIMRDENRAFLDGGDVLYTGRHVFVGLSERTNVQGCKWLRKSFPPHVPIIPVPVINNLHLKCMLTAIDENNIVVANTRKAVTLTKKIFDSIGDDADDYNVHLVENDVAANVLRCNHTIIVPKGVGRDTKSVYKDIARNVADIENLISVDNSEFTKIDGSLTCRSVLLWDDN